MGRRAEESPVAMDLNLMRVFCTAYGQGGVTAAAAELHLTAAARFSLALTDLGALAFLLPVMMALRRQGRATTGPTLIEVRTELTAP